MQSIPRILLIEDDEDDFILLRDLLSQVYGQDSRLDWTADADEALAAIAEGGHDLYLVDYRLGKRDGVELLRQATAAGCRAPMILLTGLASPTTDLQAKSAGAADYLVKDDLTAALLERAIGGALARQALHRVRTEADDLLSRKNQRIAALYKTADHFVDDLSQEFRTPLAVIKEYASVLRDGAAGAVSEEQAQFLAIIIDRAQDLSIMVNDMLDTSRLEAGLIDVSRGANQVGEILARVVPDFQRKAETAGCSLRCAVPDDLPAVYCDFETIGRVVVNLIANAFKRVETGREITVWARYDPSGPVVVVGVTHNGPGLPPADLDALFVQFKQLEGEIRSRAKGFGIGLSVVKELVHLNFGEVWVESAAGKGNTFSFSIPIFDPVAIMIRYLSRVEFLRHGSPFVSLVHLKIAEETEAAALEAVEQVLLPNVRRSDLLFRRSPDSWLLVAAASSLELDPLLRRLFEVWQREKERRPEGPWPALTTEVEGSWSVPEQRQTIIKRFEKDFAAARRMLGTPGEVPAGRGQPNLGLPGEAASAAIATCAPAGAEPSQLATKA